MLDIEPNPNTRHDAVADTMHIPDGFLDPKTALTAAAVSTVGVALAMPRVRQQLPPRKVPLLGLTAAFVFAAQMLNFPVGVGASGHLVGSTLVAVLLGPAAAIVVLTTVVLVQCFLFADGGVTALGANIFNLALLASCTGYATFRLVHRCFRDARGLIFGAAFGAWISIVLAAISCAGQLSLSGAVRWTTAFPALTTIHMLIGLGEGLITALVLVALARVRPDLLPQSPLPRTPNPKAWSFALALLLALGLALFVAPFASPLPDGLEHVAEHLGFADRAAPPAPSLMPDYSLPGTTSPVVATAAAGALGTLIVLFLSWLLARALVPRSTLNRS